MKLFNFMLLNFRYFVLCHPTPLRSQAFAAMQSIMLAMGSVGQMKLAYAIRVEVKHLETKLSNFMMHNFRYFVLCHPTPLRSHAFLAMQSIMLAMGSVGQEKLACATMV